MRRCPTCGGRIGNATTCRSCGRQLRGGGGPDGGATSQPGNSAGGQPRGQARAAGGRPTRRLPTGLTIACVLLGLLGISSVLGGLMLLDAGSTASAYGAGGAGGAITLVGLLTAGLGVAAGAAAYGLWTRAPWGWTVGVGVTGASAGTSLLLLLVGGGVVGLTGLLVYGGLCWYVYSQRWLYRQGVPGGRSQQRATRQQPAGRHQGVNRGKR